VSVTLNCTNVPFVWFGKLWNLVLTVATLETNTNETGGDWSLAESAFGGIFESGVRRSVLCWCVWGRNVSSVAVNAFSHGTYFTNKCYKCTFNAIYKDNKAVSIPPCRHQGGERKSSYWFLTSALDGGEWSASRPGRALPPGKGPRYPLYRRLDGSQGRSGHRG
jgi:hypothetical protein